MHVLVLKAILCASTLGSFEHVSPSKKLQPFFGGVETDLMAHAKGVGRSTFLYSYVF